jgi:hypothetical protein
MGSNIGTKQAPNVRGSHAPNQTEEDAAVVVPLERTNQLLEHATTTDEHHAQAPHVHTSKKLNVTVNMGVVQPWIEP